MTQTAIAGTKYEASAYLLRCDKNDLRDPRAHPGERAHQPIGPHYQAPKARTPERPAELIPGRHRTSCKYWSPDVE